MHTRFWTMALIAPLALAACNRAPSGNNAAATANGAANAGSNAAANAAGIPGNASGNVAAAGPAGEPEMVEGVNFASEPGQPPLEQTYPDAAGMPRDVQAYVVRWNDCQHWIGEPDFNAARRAQIEKAVDEACTGVDALGRRIRARHADKPAVLERLKDYGTLES